MLEIEKILTLSTAHITLDTNNMLIRESDPNFCGCLTVYSKDDYGFFIFVPDMEQLEADGLNIPNDLMCCMKLASENGCSWLCLDCAGSEAEGLVTYEW